MLRRLATLIGLPPGAGILFSRPTRRRLLLSLAGSVLTALLDMLGVAALVPLVALVTEQPTGTGVLGVINDLLGGEATSTQLAIVVSATMVAAFTLKGLLSIAFRWWQIGFVAGQEQQTASTLLRAFLAAPYALHLRRGLPDILRSLNDAVGATYSQVVVGAVSMAAEAVTIAGLTLVLTITNPVAAIVAFAYFGLAAGLLTRRLRQPTIEAGQQALQAGMAVFTAASAAIGGVKEIQVSHTGEEFARRFDVAKQTMAGTHRRQVFFGELPKYLLETVFVLGLAAMAVTVFATAQGDAAIAGLVVFLAAGTRMLPSLVRLLASLSAVRSGMPAVRLLVDELHDLHTPERLDPPARPLPPGDLHISGLCFTYPGAIRPVLRDIDLHVPHGSSVALVGPSGAGKSTLVDILLGLQSPSSGSLRVGDHDVAADPAPWQVAIGYVPQDPYWLEDSIAANVAFGVPHDEIDLVAVDRALRRAQLSEVVAALDDGVHTSIGHLGSRLSGGQRQRLAIARALYGRPQMIVLDEATSALDNATERLVTDAIEALHGDVTLVVVAHRLSTVRHTDTLIYLRDGQIAASGTFDEVRRDDADFARLVELGRLDPDTSRDGGAET